MLSQNRLAGQINRFKKQFLQLSQTDIVDLLDTEVLCKMFEKAEEELPHVLRNRIWTPVVTLFAFIKQKLIHGGCSDAVTFVQAERVRAGLEACSSNTSGYCQARQQLPETLLWDLVRYTGQQLEDASQMHWRWRGRAVKLADGSTVQMSDTPANQKAYPQESNQKEGLGFPLARIEVIASLNGGAVLDCSIGPYAGKGTGETALLRKMLPGSIQAGDIWLTDSYYESFWHATYALEHGIDILSPARSSRKINWTDGVQQGNEYYDRLFQLKKPVRPEWMMPEEYNRQPESVTVRIFRIYGKNYVTTMLNPRQYRKNALRKLYKQRWHIEVDLRFIKCVMQMEFLYCKTPEMVRKEIAATLLAYNLTRMLMVQAGIKYGAWPRNLSFSKALAVLQEFGGDLLKASGEELLSLVIKVLKIVASAKLFKRNGRVVPRDIKRRPSKKYPYRNTKRTSKSLENPCKQNLYRDWFRKISGREMCATLS